MSELKRCPGCGAKAFLNKDVVCGFFMGYSVGCPRYCVGDGIHGIDSHDVPDEKHYTAFFFNTKEAAIEWWNRRAEDV